MPSRVIGTTNYTGIRRAVGGGTGVYGVERKITDTMSDGHRGQTGLMDLKTPPRPPPYCQRRQADTVDLVRKAGTCLPHKFSRTAQLIDV